MKREVLIILLIGDIESSELHRNKWCCLLKGVGRVGNGEFVFNGSNVSVLEDKKNSEK